MASMKLKHLQSIQTVDPDKTQICTIGLWSKLDLPWIRVMLCFSRLHFPHGELELRCNCFTANFHLSPGNSQSTNSYWVTGWRESTIEGREQQIEKQTWGPPLAGNRIGQGQAPTWGADSYCSKQNGVRKVCRKPDK